MHSHVNQGSMPTQSEKPFNLQSVLKIILVTRCFRNRALGNSYSGNAGNNYVGSKTALYPQLIEEADPNVINQFFVELFTRENSKSIKTQRYTATVFFESAIDIKLFENLFPELGSFFQNSDQIKQFLQRIDQIAMSVDNKSISVDSVLPLFYSNMLEVTGVDCETLGENKFFHAYSIKHVNDQHQQDEKQHSNENNHATTILPEILKNQLMQESQERSTRLTSELLSHLKTILKTNVLKGQQLHRSTYLLINREHIKYCDANQLNDFFERLFLRKPKQIHQTGDNIVTKFLDVMMELGYFQLFFPQVQNLIFTNSDKVLTLANDLVNALAKNRIHESAILGTFYDSLLGMAKINYKKSVANNKFFAARYSKVNYQADNQPANSSQPALKPNDEKHPQAEHVTTTTKHKTYQPQPFLAELSHAPHGLRNTGHASQRFFAPATSFAAPQQGVMPSFSDPFFTSMPLMMPNNLAFYWYLQQQIEWQQKMNQMQNNSASNYSHGRRL